MSQSYDFQTQRKTVADEWAAAGKAYLCNFRPYKSTLQLVGTVLAPIPAGGTLTQAHLIFKAGQQLDFFGYGRGDLIDYGPPGVQRKATPGDTNLLKGGETHNEDFVIEGVSLSSPGKRVAYQLDVGHTNLDLLGSTDPDVLGMYSGKTAVVDPAALIQPPQVNSPFNLEDAILEACLPYMTYELVFDDRRVEDLGTLDQVPEGGGKSFLKAHGDPRVDNRARFPEGYVWRKTGSPDQNMIMRVRLENPVAIPISLVLLAAASAVTNAIPTHVLIDICARTHGVAFAVPSQN